MGGYHRPVCIETNIEPLHHYRWRVGPTTTMGETYLSMSLVMTLYVARIVSFCFPHVVDVSALSICIVLRAFVLVIYMCLLYVSLGSIVSPSIFGLMFMESVMSICS